MIDPRARIVVSAVLVGAAFVVETLAGEAALVAVALGALAAAGVGVRRVVGALRPLLPLYVVIVVVQAFVAPSAQVSVAGGLVVESGAALAALHVLQVTVVVLAALCVTATTAPSHVARALRWLLAPLRAVRVPVDDVALVLAIGLGFVPVMGQELDRIRLAQRARGIEPRGLPPRLRLRVMVAAIVPLFVLAFRRARHLAEAMHVRGFVRGAPRIEYHAWRLGPVDVAAVLATVLVAAVAARA